MCPLGRPSTRVDDAKGSTADGENRNLGSRLTMTERGNAFPIVDFTYYASGHKSIQQAYPARKKSRRWELLAKLGIPPDNRLPPSWEMRSIYSLRSGQFIRVDAYVLHTLHCTTLGRMRGCVGGQ